MSSPSLTHSGISSSSSSLYDLHADLATVPERPNEHLAVLLPKHLWKPDSLATVCDNVYCRVPFGLFERRHHCRKCGGIFCAACTSRTTSLLDSANLEFVHPPRNVPISAFDSPESPVLDARVCDDCWDQVHGVRPHSRPSMKRTHSHPVSMLKIPLNLLRNGSETSLSSCSSSPNHLDAPAVSRRRRRSLRSVSSISTDSSSQCTSPGGQHRTGILRTGHLPLPPSLEKSYGELDAYPLKRSSVLCKATGGGRWEPKQSPVLDGYRLPVPGAKAAYEIEMEREEREERERSSNPIVTDGEFRYRFNSRHKPNPPRLQISCSPYALSTF
ncbi:hypothetical protein FA15DRAFT_602682 [Coprinopsis marcescibilis]|uniref:FYVE-type domain-containing protein n=1 Tax=Coprinopsis marcescibilis TaxID=230819 RepID=A0A5C3KGK5_COPMA|nr:hypothetical protein FA15DRAFT_602682 [Coprinopsis marcescibilis]